MQTMLLPRVVHTSSNFKGLSTLAKGTNHYLPAMMYGLTMSLKNEIVKMAPKGRVNCIGPGWVKTVNILFSSRIGKYAKPILLLAHGD